MLLYAISLSSCIGSEFQREKITDNYYLITTDNYNKDIYIGYKLKTGDFVGVLPSTVFSIGNNEKYIVAKQHPFVFPVKVDSTINYYIIPIIRDTLFPENGILGPLTLEEFQMKKEELGIINVNFSKNISINK